MGSGKVSAVCGDTRTEKDFACFIECQLDDNPGFKTYHFVLDQLNTHKSESLVRLVVERCNITQLLGDKGKYGILKSIATCEDFLTNPQHSIIFHYTALLKYDKINCISDS